MEKEKWKKIKGYETFYEISSHGRIRSFDRIIVKKDGVSQKVKSQIIKPFIRDSTKITPVRHYRVAISKDGVRKKYLFTD